MLGNKYIPTIIFILTFVTFSLGQTYGNEWINYSQKYFSFKVYPNSMPNSFGPTTTQDHRVYMIDYNTLVSAGIPVGGISSANLQVFGREQEVPIYINDGGDSSMDPGDYILVVAQRNDGWLDSTLYLDPNTIGDAKYSLYNDTIQYFLTWNASTNNLRFINDNNTDFSNYTPADYIIYDRWQSNSSNYSDGERISETSSSFYTFGEGWSSSSQNGAGGGYTWNSGSMQLEYPYQGPNAPDVRFSALQIGESDALANGTDNHHVKFTVGPTNYEIANITWEGYNSILIEEQFPVSILPPSGGSNFKTQIIPDLGAVTDYQSISNWSFKYPRIPNFGGQSYFEFEIPNSTTENMIRIDATNLNYNNPIVFVFGDEPRRIKLEPNGSFYSMLIPNSTNGNEQHVVFHDSSNIVLVPQLTPVNGTGNFTDFLANGAEGALMMVYHPNLLSASVNYKNYRESNAGGNYQTVFANVNELYQQFGGGIEKHINGIRRFSHYIHNNTTSKPKGLYLMGKGIREANYNAFLNDGPGTRKNPSRFHQCLIPSFGEPSSDVFITSNLEGSSEWTPLIGTGRISAKTNQELQDYLDKVIEYEVEQDSTDVYDSPSKDWQKQIIHFTGGIGALQQMTFSSYMNQMKSRIEDTLFGGKVHSLYKTDSAPFTPSELDDVMDRINDGVSLITYFGHSLSTSSGFEINIDEVTNWSNQGKYPLMLVNSCYNGNIFQVTTSNSEEFVQIPNKGAIAYIASIRQGFASFLRNYSYEMYKQMSQVNYGATLGDQMKATIQSLEGGSSSLYNETTCAQMVLNGDPMLHLNYHVKPEIEITEQSISFSPTEIDLSVDSITLSIELKNLGRTIRDTIILEITRNFPGSNFDSTYIRFIPNLYYTKTIDVKIPLQPSIGIGLNTFNVKVDIPTVYDEVYDEVFNNQVTKTLYIAVDGIIPVEPYEFAVIPDDSVTLKASTMDPIAPMETYRFEIDTIDFIGSPSPAHRFAVLTELGGVKEVFPSDWTLSANPSGNGKLILEDSVVYFWRVSIEGDTNWRESSFQYIPGKQGWGQDHFFQFKKNDFYGINYNRANRLKELVPTYFKNLSVDVLKSSSSAELLENAYYLDGLQQDFGFGCFMTDKLLVAVIDPITLQPWGTRYQSQNPNNDFGNENDNGACSPRVMKYFTFYQTNATSLSNFQNMVNNEVPDGHYLLIYTPEQARHDLWTSIDSLGMYSTFQALGSDSVNANRPNRTFAFFCRKGIPSSVVEAYADYQGGDVHLEATVYGEIGGRESAPLIGPSNSWGNIYWKQDSLENPTTDSTTLTIKAYSIEKALQFEIDTLFSPNDSLLNLGSFINASSYPYISLEATYKDELFSTPAQIDRWHVLFQPVPEAAIDGTNNYTWTAGDTLSEGMQVQFAVDVRNIFTVDMDSLLINYWIKDNQQIKYPISYPRQDSLKINETLRDTISFSTVGLSGWNTLEMEVNPYINGSLSIKDQPEQEHFNNLLSIPFFVTKDDENPILDVTFDGQHILNGDIVNPYSEVLITLKDDNEFLIMDNISDTSLFGVYLIDPSGNQKRIPFEDGLGNTIMQWIPADVQNKRFKIIWSAQFMEDGTYTLYVQGEDRSGNLSGDIDYTVNFEVIHESSITKMMNYPNPFSTSTRFVFTLTGSEVPDDIIIQIMTISGRVVREITENELGELRIGRNITEYAWDGKDEFGDPLANGVYLYRVKARINGEDIKNLDLGADVFFKKDFGKMYILR